MNQAQQIAAWRDAANLELFFLKEMKKLLKVYPMSRKDLLDYVKDYIRKSEAKINKIEAPSRETITGLPAISEGAEMKMQNINS